MQAETGQRRDEYMDWLKGAAILSMVMGHLLTGVPEGAGIFNVIYSFHMPLLFFVSAYVEQAGRDKYADGRWRMLGKRAAGLLFPYVSWSIVYAVYKRSFRSVTLGSLLAALTEYEGNGLWFLLVLFGLKVLHLLYWEIGDRIGAGGLWKPLLILAGLESVTAAAALALRIPFLVNMVSYAIPYFAAVLLAEREQIGRCVRSQWVIAAAIAAYVIVFPRFSFYDTGWTTQVMRIGLSLCAIVVLWKLREQGTLIGGGISGRMARLFGRYSMEIYLLHGFFCDRQISLQGIESPLALLCVTFAEAVVIAALCVAAAGLLELSVWWKKILFGK